ncbi:MAG: DUF2614 family zinc ribbon-containing protein, partial [Bacillota bacterium]|nr:DUF2614 family zinc ribbon-containing protein [Bacillota bacterium]
PAPVNVTLRPVVVEISSNAPSDEDLEDMISERRAIRQPKTGGFCPNCGKPTKMLGRVDMCMYCNEPLTLDPKLQGKEFNEDYNKKKTETETETEM